MDTVTVSPKYRVVITKRIRERLKVQKGQKFHVFIFEGRIELIPAKNIKEMRGFLKGMDIEVTRENNRILSGAWLTLRNGWNILQ